jgi:mannitol/fructose-specific phosphotransferase system IIA component (Ntr-type)
MAQKLDPTELVEFKELLMANSVQLDALVQLLIEKGIITKDEFFEKLKQVYAEYQSRKDD